MVLGIDGMDYDVVSRNIDKLPNLSSMLDREGRSCIKSIFPPDTTPAWATIFTGMDPSEHGIINFINKGDKENRYRPLEINDSLFKGKTFWDKCNEMGLRTVVLFPINIYPGWEINGLMITRGSKDTKVWSDRGNEYNPNGKLLSLDGKFNSTKKLGSLLKELNEKLDEEYRIAKETLLKEEWDMFYVYFSTLDAVQHIFWKYCDENHPDFPGKNKYFNAILDMYIKMDKYIGELMSENESIDVIILSDHGHGARPVYIARINEMLFRESFLYKKKNNGNSMNNKIKSILKRVVINSIKKFGMPSIVLSVAKKVPVWKKLFASSSEIDFSRTEAYLSDLSAIKNYSFGGIRINDSVKDKEAVADKVINSLENVKIDGEEKKAFNWIGKREELYQGEMIEKFPEILFQLDERYGAEWEFGEKLFEKKGYMHELSPGSHRWNTAVYFTNNNKLYRKDIRLEEIYSIVIDYFEGDESETK